MLVERIRAGDKKARNELVERNLPLIRFVANELTRGGKFPAEIELEDLLSEGALGLIRAAETFDPSKAKFSTFAVPTIRGYMTRGCKARGSMIRLPVYVRSELAKREREVALSDREPRFDERAQLSSAGEERLRAALATRKSVLSLTREPGEDPLGPEDPRPGTLDLVLAREAQNAAEGTVRRWLAGLNGAHRQVLVLRYGLNGKVEHTRGEVAALLGVTPRTVFNREASALKRLRLAALGDQIPAKQATRMRVTIPLEKVRERLEFFRGNCAAAARVLGISAEQLRRLADEQGWMRPRKAS